jgi:hypothetical protein
MYPTAYLNFKLPQSPMIFNSVFFVKMKNNEIMSKTRNWDSQTGKINGTKLYALHLVRISNEN